MRRFWMTIGICASLALPPHALTAADETDADEMVSEETDYLDETADVRALIGDVAAGKKLYRRNCRACHGATAGGASSYPKLVGQPAGFLVDRIARYRAGEKFGPNTPLMAQRVKKLSDQSIANVAAFILSLNES